MITEWTTAPAAASWENGEEEKPEILLISRCKTVSRDLQKILSELKYDLDTTPCREEGTRKLRVRNFKALLLDLAAENGNSLAFLRSLKNTHRLLPIVLLFDENHPDILLPFLREAPDGILPYPAGKEEVQKVLQKALRSMQLTVANERLRRRSEECSFHESNVQRLRKQLNALSRVFLFSGEIREGTDQGQVYQRLSDTVADLMECRRAVLWMRDDEHKPFTIRSVGSVLPGGAEELGQPELENKLCNLAAHYQTPLLLNNPGECHGPFAFLFPDFLGALPLLCIPLTRSSVARGVLLLSGRTTGEPFVENDLHLLSGLLNQAAACVENAELFQKLSSENEKNQRELEMAFQIQRGFLPSRMPRIKNLRIYAENIPAKKVGGDFYGFVRESDSRLTFFLGDVAGKGVPAALIMAMTTNVLFENARKYDSPAEVLKASNRGLRYYLGANSVHYVTALFGTLDIDRLELHYARAGHERPILLHGRNGALETLDAPGLVLGLFADGKYENRTAALQSGDRLLFHTDGVLDAKNAQGEIFGLERFLSLLQEEQEKSSSIDLNAKLIAAVRGFAGERPLQDDLTLMSMEIECRETVERVVPSLWNDIRPVEHELQQFLQKLGLPKHTLSNITFSTHELITNALEHGNGSDPEKRIRISWTEDGLQLTIRVADEGSGFSPSALPDPTSTEHMFRERGRGIYMIRRMVDALEYSEKGNEATITVRL
jgi:serine phosphatase RsbU (regulator of sigma subunit)/anti-sigma regulatory factor (Ser/Thr protein kinase)/DNA-binding NarL/FixJ family response regulator